MNLPGRPYPPEGLCDAIRLPEAFLPAPDVVEWMRSSFIEMGAPLENPEHAHLRFADIGVLWTNVPNARQMRLVAGTAEIPQPRGAKWAKARAEIQLKGWFGRMPDFLITLDAPHASALDDASFCALVEHELYHCGQALDEYGGPKFTRDGAPVLAMRGHDVEEFVGVVERYGARAAGVEDLVRVAGKAPLVGVSGVAGVCGTCLRAA